MIRWSSAHWYTVLASGSAFFAALTIAVSISNGALSASWAWGCFLLTCGAWLGFAVLVHEWRHSHAIEHGDARILKIGER